MEFVLWWPPTVAHGPMSLHLYVSCGGGVGFSFVCLFCSIPIFILSYFIFISEIQSDIVHIFRGQYN